MTGLAVAMKDDDEQRQHIRRVVWAGIVGSVAHIILLFLTHELGFFRGEMNAIVGLIAFQATGYVAFFAYMYSGRNRQHADPSLTMPLLVWATTAILVSAYFVDQVRLCVMIMFFVFMVEGAFRLKMMDFVLLSLYCVIGYLLILFVVKEQFPENIDRTAELIQWAAFALLTTGFAFMTGEISKIRHELERRKRQNVTAKARMEELAVKDELTQLYNRRHAMELLRQHKGLADRGAYEFAVCYVDLDHFKQINDNFGHHVGDLVLKRFAQAAMASVSAIDHVARLGGEEFVAILVKTDLETARKTSERLRVAVAAIDFSDIEPRLKVSASLGLTMYRTHEKPEALLSRADEALYASKQGGRNRVTVI
jgi:diguanylate cyclase (GGDEF)-like protein